MTVLSYRVASIPKCYVLFDVGFKAFTTKARVMVMVVVMVVSAVSYIARRSERYLRFHTSFSSTFYSDVFGVAKRSSGR